MQKYTLDRFSACSGSPTFRTEFAVSYVELEYLYRSIFPISLAHVYEFDRMVNVTLIVFIVKRKGDSCENSNISKILFFIFYSVLSVRTSSLGSGRGS